MARSCTIPPPSFQSLIYISWFFQCNVNGAQGDGTQAGTCGTGMVCNTDGSCTLCAVTGSFPHGGCTSLNPICNGGSSCVCDPNGSLSCTSDIHSTCDGHATTSPFAGGTCKCGTNSACSTPLPSCKAPNFAAVTDASSATCQVKSLHFNATA